MLKCQNLNGMLKHKLRPCDKIKIIIKLKSTTSPVLSNLITLNVNLYPILFLLLILIFKKNFEIEFLVEKFLK